MAMYQVFVAIGRSLSARFCHVVSGGLTMNTIRSFYVSLLAMLAAVTMAAAPASAQQAKPNILVIMGDDIGYLNINAYNRGQMGYRTPNINRIAKPGSFSVEQAMEKLRNPLSSN